MINKIIIAIDNFLYRKLNVVTFIRKGYWRRNGKDIQRKLDVEHNTRDWYNKVNNTNYTTKMALKKIDNA